MHGREEEAGVCGFAADVARPVDPVASELLDRCRGIVPLVDELHETADVVGFTGRFAHEIDKVWLFVSTPRGREASQDPHS